MRNSILDKVQTEHQKLMPGVLLGIYVYMVNHQHHLQIRFIEIVTKDEINPESGIHYIMNDNSEHFLTDLNNNQW